MLSTFSKFDCDTYSPINPTPNSTLYTLFPIILNDVLKWINVESTAVVLAAYCSALARVTLTHVPYDPWSATGGQDGSVVDKSYAVANVLVSQGSQSC